MKRPLLSWLSALICLVAGAAALEIGSAAALARDASAAAPVFDDAFWRRWGDGRAELAAYDLTFPRYGELRKGIAVAVFVTETFSNSERVKSDPGKHSKSDEFPVMKLNLVQDFSTGLYDYNIMTSAFVSLAPVNGRPAGSVTKVSFSSQEWCGQVYEQALFDAGSARLSSHSYFDGEADRSGTLAVPSGDLDGDALLLWARGFAAPTLAPGERRAVPLVTSLRTARLLHQSVAVGSATLTRQAVPIRVSVPAGTFDAERRMVEIAGGPNWTILVEAAEPHRILQWRTSDGEEASLIASDRLEYWKMHGQADLPALARLGLKPRPPRTP